jgi:diacylglycerol kinase (ATP)
MESKGTEMRIAAVVNPFAGRRTAERRWPILLRSIGRDAAGVDTFWSEYPGHSEALAASARRSGYDRVIAVGGDGTLFEVLNGLWWEEQGQMPSLGMVPFGTGCDYIRNFEVAKETISRVRAAVAESTIQVSIGRCRYQVQDGIRQRVFAMVLGLGFDAEVVRRFNSSTFLRSSWLSYALSALAALRELRPFVLDGIIDNSPFRSDAIFLAAALGCSFGKGMRIAPDASPTRNQFELVHAAPAPVLSLFPPMLRAYMGLLHEAPGISRLRGKTARFRSSMPILFEADGELLGQTSEIEIELIPDAIFFAAKMCAGKENNLCIGNQ